MTTLTKAAQEAAEESKLFIFKETKYALHQTQVDVIKEINLLHLAPVQAELDRLKREMNEAREMIQSVQHKYKLFARGCHDDCQRCKFQAWLERNK